MAKTLSRLPFELAILSQRTPVLLSRTLSSCAALRSTVEPKHFYATTPIFYVNAAPHVGHLHSMLLADVYTRFAALQDPTGPQPILCTGTDEHGLKIQRVAEAQSVTPKVLCDSVSERFRVLAREAGVNHTVFMRTTEERHRVAVNHVWRELAKRGHIYKASYAGWYAVSDEAYYPEAQVVEIIDPKDGSKSMVSKETGSMVEWMEEETYKFRLSAFREPLIKWLSECNVLQPPSRAKDLLSSLCSESSSDLDDLSISRPRSRLSWGIAVPDDPEHTIYVWVDALVNYLTAAGYPWVGGEAYKEGEVWPPELQIVGKDIVRFHALYLPAILMALDLPLPKALLAHGHWTMDKFKMSKSRGNVADPFQAMQLWGTDPMRAYLMRVGGNSSGDADYSPAEIERFYKKDLLSSMGNLLSRISNAKLLDRLPTPEWLHTPPISVQFDDELIYQAVEELPQRFKTAMDEYKVHHAMAAIFETLYEANRYLQLQSPWSKTASLDTIHRSMYYVSEALRVAAILLTPTMPTKAAECLDVLGVEAAERSWGNAKLAGGGQRTMVVGGSKLFPHVALPTDDVVKVESY